MPLCIRPAWPGLLTKVAAIAATLAVVLTQSRVRPAGLSTTRLGDTRRRELLLQSAVHRGRAASGQQLRAGTDPKPDPEYEAAPDYSDRQWYHAGPAFRNAVVTKVESASGKKTPRVTASRETPGFRCRVCEDVAMTWRETYPCVGSGTPISSPRQMFDLQSCAANSNCMAFRTHQPGGEESDTREQTCMTLTKDFRENSETRRTLWELVNHFSYDMRDNKGEGANLLERGRMRYDACTGLSQCRSLDDSEGQKCQSALISRECMDDIHCPAARNACTPQCHICYWISTGWPKFQGMCKYAIFQGDTKFKPDEGFEIGDSKEKIKKREDDYVQEGAGSPALEEDAPQLRDPINAKEEVDYEMLANECFGLWDEWTESTKARYLTSMVDQLGPYEWSPNIVCKCMQKCPYNQFEGLALQEACKTASALDYGRDTLDQSMFPDLTPEGGNPEALGRPFMTEYNDQQQANQWLKKVMGGGEVPPYDMPQPTR